MKLGKTYISKAGVKRKPLQFSECNRFVKTETTFSNGKTVIKHYWKVTFENRIKIKKWHTDN